MYGSIMCVYVCLYVYHVRFTSVQSYSALPFNLSCPQTSGNRRCQTTPRSIMSAQVICGTVRGVAVAYWRVWSPPRTTLVSSGVATQPNSKLWKTNKKQTNKQTNKNKGIGEETFSPRPHKIFATDRSSTTSHYYSNILCRAVYV